MTTDIAVLAIAFGVLIVAEIIYYQVNEKARKERLKRIVEKY